MKEYHPNEQYRYASIKRDGHFTTVTLGGGELHVYSRGGFDITRKVGWMPCFRELKRFAFEPEPPREFHGELWLPGSPCTSVPVAQRERNAALRFDVFSCAHFKRGTAMEEVADDAEYCGLSVIPFWNFEMKELENHYRRSPLTEGFVYSDGNRLHQAKNKPMRTADLVVVGGSIGRDGLVVSLALATSEGEEMCSVSVAFLSEEFRQWLTSEFESLYYGRVVEVRYQGVGAGGRLRHPVFLRFRDEADKLPSECGIDQFL